jgi:4-diphosphocytidyl-2-C-methyl-D-erythritol kinase
MKAMRVTRQASAKVNLSLLVGPTRSDGYHELFTVFAPIHLFDELSFALSLGQATSWKRPTAGMSGASGRISLTGPGLNDPGLEGEDNLAVRALRALEALSGRCISGEVALSKGIPVGAGLGGGSSDAACALMVGVSLLAQKGKVEVDDETLWGLASRLGADVPFFLQHGAALARGIGDHLERLELPPIDLVMVLPSASLSTPSVYAAYDRLTGTADPATFAARSERLEMVWRQMAESWESGDLCEDEVAGAVCALLVNDLEEASFSLMPELLDIKKAILEAGALGALMSGSGPTLFGVCRSSADSAVVASRLEARGYAARPLTTITSPV